MFYYLLSKGQHPFGNRFEREQNILKGKFDLNDVDMDLVNERVEEFQHMITMMIKPDPKLRSRTSKITNHVFFWNNDKKLKVIQEISDKLEYQTSNCAKDKEGNNPESTSNGGKKSESSNTDLQTQLNKIGKKFKIINEFLGWPRQLDPCLLTELKKFRKYDSNQFTDLLRFIRNKKNHFRELPDEVK